MITLPRVDEQTARAIVDMLYSGTQHYASVAAQQGYHVFRDRIQSEIVPALDFIAKIEKSLPERAHGIDYEEEEADA